MEKVRAFKVKTLANIDLIRYKEGDIFITARSVGILANNEIKTFNFERVNLKDYVKKKDVQKMIEKELEKRVN